MSCEKMKLTMLDRLYGEADTESAAVLQSHLDGCEACRSEWKILQSMRDQLASDWPDIDAPLKMVFVRENVTFLGRLREMLALPKLPRPGWAAGMAFAVLGLFLLLAVFNSRFTYEGGRMQLQFSLAAPTAAPPADAVVLTRAQWNELQQAQLAQFQQILTASENRQRVELGKALICMAQKMDYQRGQDLRWVEQGLKQIDYNTAIKFAETDRMLNGVVQYALQDQKPAARP